MSISLFDNQKSHKNSTDAAKVKSSLGEVYSKKADMYYRGNSLMVLITREKRGQIFNKKLHRKPINHVEKDLISF